MRDRCLFLYIVFFSTLLSLLNPSPALAQNSSRKIDPSAIQVPDGYQVEAIVADLSVPTTAIFDKEDLIIAESGFVNSAPPRVLRITPNGQVTVLASAGLVEPVTGLVKVNNQLFVSHRGKVSVIENNGTLKDIVTNLPSLGDHHNNNIVLGPEGKIYLGQGTTTNSGVVGTDNYISGWLKKDSLIHEIPCRDVTLVGQNFESVSPFEKGKKVLTGSYKPYGIPSVSGEVIPGNQKCGGSIARFNPDGTGFEVVAWG